MARLTDESYLGLATDVHTFGRAGRSKRRSGLVAVALPGASCVIAIDMAEWVAAQVTLLELAGVPHFEQPSAMARAQAAKPVRK